MRRSRLASVSWVSFIAMTAVACSGGGGNDDDSTFVPLDARPAYDSGPLLRDGGAEDAGHLDGGLRDGGESRDAGEPRDGGDVERDGGPSRDGGIRDAGPPRDAGAPRDAGPPRDGGGVRDGGALPGVANETDAPEECDFCNLQFPASITMTAGETTPDIYGRIYEAGVTEPAGPGASIIAELGYGPAGSDPTTSAAWTWQTAAFNMIGGNDDEFMGAFTISNAGSYLYTFRFSLDGRASFSYGDLDGAGSNPGLTFSATQLGVLTVN